MMRVLAMAGVLLLSFSASAKENRSKEKRAAPPGCGIVFDICVVCGDEMYCGMGHEGNPQVDTTAFQLEIGCSGPCLTGTKLPLRLYRLIESIELSAPRFVPVEVPVAVAVPQSEYDRLKKLHDEQEAKAKREKTP